VIDYDPGRVAREQATWVAECLQVLLANVIDAGDAPLGDLPMRVGFAPSSRNSGVRAEPGAPTVPTLVAARPAGPADHVNAAVIEIWRRGFGDPTLSDDAHFFDLGGDSLKAVLIVGECNARFKVNLPLTIVFERPTVGGLVDAIRSAVSSARSGPLVALRQGGDGDPVVLIHPAGGTLFCYRDLIARLPSAQPIYGLQAFGVVDSKDLPESVEELARSYIRAALNGIEARRWHLMGWSFGGLVAYEMAVQLTEIGQTPASLTLIDTPSRPIVADGEDERSVLAAVAGALGVDLASLEVEVPTIEAIVSEARLRPGNPTLSLPQAEGMAQLVRHLRRLRRRYRPARLSGSMTLFRACADATRREDAFEWGNFITGDVDVIGIATTHESIVYPPYVDMLAARLTEILRLRQSSSRHETPRSRLVAL
jgi:thioesterase domain-containing protein/acyl carrier protein